MESAAPDRKRAREAPPAAAAPAADPAAQTARARAELEAELAARDAELAELRRELKLSREELYGVREELSGVREELSGVREESNELRTQLCGDRACSGALSAELNARRYPAPAARTPTQAAACEDRLFRVLGIVGGLGFWEAWRLPLVCRELRFGFSGGGAPADMIKLGLEKQGVWAELREAQAARRDEEEKTRLHDACDDDVEDVQRVCELIELGWPGSVEARDNLGWTPLMNASWSGHAGIVKALLAAGADANAASNSDKTALLFACYFGHLEAARALVASGANVNAVDQDGDTPLNLARGRNGPANPAIEALLLAAGATRMKATTRTTSEEPWRKTTGAAAARRR
jgi:Ankyrin repeats (3 copies)